MAKRFILRTAGTSETACSCKHTVKETRLIDIPTPVNGFKLIINSKTWITDWKSRTPDQRIFKLKITKFDKKRNKKRNRKTGYIITYTMALKPLKNTLMWSKWDQTHPIAALILHKASSHCNVWYPRKGTTLKGPETAHEI